MEEIVRSDDLEERSTESIEDNVQGISASNLIDKCDEDNEEASADPSFQDLIDENKLLELEKNLTEQEKIKNYEYSKALKEQGNKHFKETNYSEALDFYTNALRLCPLTHKLDRSVLFSNRAACKRCLNANKAAVCDCTKALELNPNYLKALLRRAKLYEELEQFDESLEDYKRILEIEPYNKEAKDALVRLPPIIHERNEKLKEDLLGKLKDLGNMVLRPFGLSTSNFQMQQDPNTGSYSINFNK